MKRICLVTEELAEVGRSGGIGAAFKEMALFLSGKGYVVDIIFCTPSNLTADQVDKSIRFYASHGIKLEMLDLVRYVDTGDRTRAVSYAAYQTLKRKKAFYDFIHFHDYKGIGFYSCEAKRQGDFFRNTTIVVQLHGPTRWALEANATFFTHEDQLAIDFMERESIRWADQVVSPSAYMAKWVRDNFFSGVKSPEIKVIKNLCRHLFNELRGDIDSDNREEIVNRNTHQIIVFARHEERKGIVQACDALDLVGDDLAQKGIKVSFVGQPGFVTGQPSAIYFIERSKNWKFDFDFLFDFGRMESARFLRSAKLPLVIIPSPQENSPYTVLETLVLGVPMLASLEGGGIELVHESDRSKVLCPMNGQGLAGAIRRVISEGRTIARLAESIDEVERAWLSFHQDSSCSRKNEDSSQNNPLVTVGITHYERPEKVIDALISVLRQTYQNIEIIMVDDGSKKTETIKSLDYCEVLLKRAGGCLIRQKNSYLGAARNSVLRASKGDYVVFLDDDDLAMPCMVETLVRSALKTGADVVTCLNAYMPEAQRPEVLGGIVKHESRVSYFPLGGPLSLATEQNVFGSATALLRRASVDAVGGYTELDNVGHEDYELYIRLFQDGAKFSVCPEPLFYYEVGRPSMISRTSMMRNYRRCFDSVLFGKSVKEWQDYMNLCVGRLCSVNTHNRAHYLNSQAATSSLRLPLMKNDLPIEEYVQIATKLASAEGNRRAATAFAYALSHKRDAESQAMENEVTLEYLLANEIRHQTADTAPIDLELVKIRFELSLGRIDDALQIMEIYANKCVFLVDDVFLVLSEFSKFHINPAEISRGKQIANKLSKCRVKRPSDKNLFLLLKFFIHFGLSNEASEILRALHKKDEEEYLERYPDVQQEVRNGAFRALEHFAWHGQVEGRWGFERCQQAAKTIGAMFSKSFPVEYILELTKFSTDGGSASSWGHVVPSEATA